MLIQASKQGTRQSHGQGSRQRSPSAHPARQDLSRPAAVPLLGGSGRPDADVVSRSVAGLGYELVDIERVTRGLLRVTIDRVPGRAYDGEPSEAVTVDDCERVTRQLQYVLEVEGVDYARLEVSSPGVDRPLKRDADYARFVGQVVSLTLKQPFQGRKSYSGVLARVEAAEGDAEAGTVGGLGAAAGRWSVVFHDGKQDQVLTFTLSEVREAKLVPVLDFKGRKSRSGVDAGMVPVQGVDGPPGPGADVEGAGTVNGEQV